MEGDVYTTFSVLELPDSTTQSIVDALCKLCEDLNLDIDGKLCSLGSDGATVVVGARGGVAKLLKDRVPFLVSHRCITHHLALACGQSADEITYLI